MGEHIPRNIARREQRLPEVARRYGMGMPLVRIAEELGVSSPLISRDVKLLHERWLATANADFALYASEQMHKIDLMEAEYWEAWLASKADDETSLSKEKTGAAAGKEVWVRKRRQVGNPAFLDGVMNCVRERCKLLGLYAGSNLPRWRSVEGGGEDGADDNPVDVERELSRLNADLDDWARSCRRPSPDELPPGFRPAP
jgi:hypothetical protein